LIREGAALVARAGLWSLSDADLREAVREGHAVTGAVESAWLGLVAGLDARPDVVPGARPGRVAATFLVHGLRVAAGKAATDVAGAHALDPEGGVLPGLATAFAAGEVSRAHVDVAVRVMRRLPSHLLTRVDEHGTSNAERLDAFLTEQSRVLAPPVTDRLAARVLDHLDPDRLDRFDPLAYQRRELTAVVDSTGMLVLRGQCDPAGGAVVRAALEHFAASPARPAGQTEDGQTVLVPDDRSRAQRYADALVAVCRQALSSTDPARPHPSQILIVTTPEQVAAARAHPPSPGGTGGASAGPAECVQTGPIGAASSVAGSATVCSSAS